MNTGTVIIGAGQAGAQLAISLRELGYSEKITLIGDEEHLPYQRPPLSKEYMSGQLADLELPLRTADYYEKHAIEVVTADPAARICREEAAVTLASGRRVPYTQLVLATGARNRRLPLEGREPANVHYLRTRDDAARLREALGAAQDILIVGAGFIGLEFASVARLAGARVTVVEMADRVMGRAVSEEISVYFAARHTAWGAEVLCSTSVDEFQRAEDGRVTAVRIGDRTLPVDLVLVGIGVIPNAELAQEAGLAVGNGIVVDSGLTTSDPSVFAIGDCASHPRPETAGLVRVESVQNAADQARFLARRLCSQDGDYADVPWFWSHQTGDKLQIAGLAQPTDGTVVLGDPGAGHFSVARVRDGRLAAVESVNSPGDHLASRRLLANGAQITEEQLHQPGFTLRKALHAAPEGAPTNHRLLERTTR
ncbi:NAD(P)/FAD-dependent oxidoreductase [Sinomonas atrocyanea]|uniref:NAD(P)/FAD-dependent oxidoreductase n=1 Tax=Sinomonas atrocyanea TaxID=37927 RepID=UPI002786CFA8|nr:FAD-dependent oxidoreductase [Sinomonas atrocyanea]MDQ0260848.1 3-phenylpropionate/trans-cinnamate dioxygenase ferredoxin reductase subunit [Sinomonas atrocyanea]MDR6621576.1 3-phenylpropionate/trans-cinnamate dioxygenase ferredoxin reductase subunit [Sinomonas atrocyanea]